MIQVRPPTRSFSWDGRQRMVKAAVHSCTISRRARTAARLDRAVGGDAGTGVARGVHG